MRVFGSQSSLIDIAFACALTVGMVISHPMPQRVCGEVPSPVQRVLETRCLSCHGPNKQNAEIRFDTLSDNFVEDRAAAETWQEALHAVQRGEMPPEDGPSLDRPERELLTGWIAASIQAAVEAQANRIGHVALRRLNLVEYQNTMTDLLDLEMDYIRDFPPDAVSAEGFRNDGEALQISGLQLEYYLSAARRALEKVIVEGPAPKVFEYQFSESVVQQWLGPTEPSNHLGRSQKFLATMVDEYPEWGDFLVRVHLTAELKPEVGFPILEVAVGFRPDTQVLFRAFEPVEITSEDRQVFEFRGRLEDFPLPVRGQGKYPGLVVRIQNIYDNGSMLPEPIVDKQGDGKKNKFVTYPDEPHLPKLHLALVEFEGPISDHWPPPRHLRILPESQLRHSNEIQRITSVLRSFLQRAYRRPVTEGELQSIVNVFADIREESPSFEYALRETLAFVLIRPEFLYHGDADARGSDQSLDDWGLANRLSYFLWSTMPDDRLFELASKGILHEPGILQGEVERLLEDPRSEQFIRNFSDQWLQLDTMYSVAISPNYYPDFDNALKQQMQHETHAFFGHLVNSNGNALQLLDASFSMMNEPLARHYGIPGIYGQAFRRVEIETSRPGGLLGHGSIMLANSTGEDSHAVRRAVWIRDRLLGDPPNSPPPNVPALDEADRKFLELSVREQLQAHRNDSACADCHDDLDPFGIALEQFDAVGLRRDEVRRMVGEEYKFYPVEPEGRLPDGTYFDGIESLKQYLVSKRHQDFSRALVERLMIYALGRRMELVDQSVVADIAARFAEEGYPLRKLIHLIVASESFASR